MRDLPGYGDPETWGAPTGHPNDPRTEDAYGPCRICGEESSEVVAAGTDADEDGEYFYIVFEHPECGEPDEDDDEEDVPWDVAPEEEPEGRTPFEWLQQNVVFVILVLIGFAVGSGLLLGLLSGMDSEPEPEVQVHQNAEQDARDEALYACIDRLYWGVAHLVDNPGNTQAETDVINAFGTQSWEHRWVMDNYYAVVMHQREQGTQAAVDMTYELAFETCAERVDGGEGEEEFPRY